MALALTALTSSVVQAQTYPSRTIKIIAGFPPGTSPDFVARLFAQKLQEGLGQPVVVENMAGAGGLIAAQAAARATPDGYTVFLNTVSDTSIAPHMYSKLSYDPRDFSLISHLVYADLALVVPAKVPVRTLAEYVNWARQQKPLFLATFGPGTPAHFGNTMFGNAIGIKPEPVHYKTTSDAMTGVLSGEVPGVFASPALAAPYVKDGRLRALAVTSPVRIPVLPDVPTFKELGHPEVTFASWFGLAAPPRTPPEVLERLSTEAQKVMKSTEVREKLEATGFRVTGTGRDEFARIVREEAVLWGQAVKASGFKAD